VKRLRHTPDASRRGYTYCGRCWEGPTWTATDVAAILLPVIDLKTDDSAECKACQRSDDRRTRDILNEERLRLHAWADTLPNAK
jgi:hypothetical protein